MTLAVLIDADNVSGHLADNLFAAIGKIGTMGLRRMYGDFREARLGPWEAAAGRHRIRRRQTPCNGRNASDLALMEDALKLLRGRTFNGFCIVSSDGDFAALAMLIRESGIAVYGFGEAKAPAILRKACTRFVPLQPVHAKPVRQLASTLRPATA
ncbi:MAG: NYN domain-containing protein [Rhizomicrobium sp.]